MYKDLVYRLIGFYSFYNGPFLSILYILYKLLFITGTPPSRTALFIEAIKMIGEYPKELEDALKEAFPDLFK